MAALSTTVSCILPSSAKLIRWRTILFSSKAKNKLCFGIAPAHSFNFETPIERTLQCVLRNKVSRGCVRIHVRDSAAKLKDSWLASLSSPFLQNGEGESHYTEERASCQNDGGWVLGVDPDVSGALALLKRDDSKPSAQVFDSPYVKVLVGKRVRKRLDAKSIAHLIQRLNIPIGTTAYVEQSTPCPQDGKLAWWCGGFGYGLWLGILVASGFSVIPVSSVAWKNQFELCGSPRRAEALLIAAYGKGIKRNLSALNDVTESIPSFGK